MKIGIDIDDTITNTTPAFFKVLKKYNIDKSIYYLPFDSKIRIEFLKKYHDEIMEITEIKEEVKENLDRLKQMGHYLVVITARNNEYGTKAVELAKEMIKKYNLPIDEIHFNEPYKVELCKKLKIDLMIDDNKIVCKNMKKNNINCLQFGKDISNWNDVIKYLQEKEDLDG